MPEQRLAGRHVFVVEDEYFLARDLALALSESGATVVGPVASLADAMRLLGTATPDCAVLDINLGGEPVYPLADALSARQVPFIFLTGYDRASIPTRWADTPLLEKPVEADIVVDAIGRALHDSRVL